MSDVENEDENEDIVIEDVEEVADNEESDESEHEDDEETENENEDIIFELNASILKDKKAEAKSIEKIIIPDNKRNCRAVISDFELSKVLSIRSTQIATTGISFSEMKTINPIELAKDEIRLKKCPLKIMRRVDIYENIPKYEIWSINELEIINLDMGF